MRLINSLWTIVTTTDKNSAPNMVSTSPLSSPMSRRWITLSTMTLLNTGMSIEPAADRNASANATSSVRR